MITRSSSIHQERKRKSIDVANQSFLSRVYYRYGFRHLVPIIVLIGYSLGGALIFMLCERQKDMDRRKIYRNVLDGAKQHFINMLQDIRANYYKFPNQTADSPHIFGGSIDRDAVFRDANVAFVQYLSTVVYMLIKWHHLTEKNAHQIWKLSHIEWPNTTLPLLHSQLQVIIRTLEELEVGYANKSELWMYNETATAVTWYEEQLGVQSWRLRELSDSPWDLWGALFYAGTIYTTIGYGHVTTVTPAGRAVTVLYAILGIPLFLTILNMVGKLMSDIFRRGWANCCHAYLSFKARLRYYLDRRKQSELLPGNGSPFQQQSSRIEYPFPILLSIALLIFWILFSAGIFSLLENSWSYLTAVYFVFISLSTIGLGDIVPQYPQYMIMLFILIVIGLAIVSMCLNVIQMKIETLFEEMLIELETTYEISDSVEGLTIPENDSTITDPYEYIAQKNKPIVPSITGALRNQMAKAGLIPGLSNISSSTHRKRLNIGNQKNKTTLGVLQTDGVLGGNKMYYNLMSDRRKQSLKRHLQHGRLLVNRSTQTDTSEFTSIASCGSSSSLMSVESAPVSNKSFHTALGPSMTDICRHPEQQIPNSHFLYVPSYMDDTESIATVSTIEEAPETEERLSAEVSIMLPPYRSHILQDPSRQRQSKYGPCYRNLDQPACNYSYAYFDPSSVKHIPDTMPVHFSRVAQNPSVDPDISGVQLNCTNDREALPESNRVVRFTESETLVSPNGPSPWNSPDHCNSHSLMVPHTSIRSARRSGLIKRLQGYLRVSLPTRKAGRRRY